MQRLVYALFPLALTACAAATRQPPFPAPGTAGAAWTQEHGEAEEYGEAREHAAGEEHASEGGEEHGGEHGEEHGAGTQALNAFLGASRGDGDANGLTVGLDYEYRLSPKWGVGGFAEAVTRLNRSFAAGIQGYWHAYADLVLVAGPGVERADEHGWGPILRVGAFYELELGGGWVVSPALFYDFTESENLVIFGANVGYIW